MLSTLGDRDYYYASGKQIKVTLDLLVGPADYDLFLHIYVPDGNQWEYLTTWSGETVGDDGISCHHTTPCPDNAHAQATKLFIIEVRGKDDSTDFGPWPYKLKIHWGAG
jgi:hypothetical protein